MGEGLRERVSKSAFTLAEVLITLGIIGVVAAMTIPVLVQKYKYQVVEVRLKKFYTSINQAIKLSEVQNGAKELWYVDNHDTAESLEWFKNYIGKYMNILKYETLSDGTFLVYFPDGSAMQQLNSNFSREYVFYPGNPNKCLDHYNGHVYNTLGKCGFKFMYFPADSNWYYKYHYLKGVEPARYGLSGSRDEMKATMYEDCSDPYQGKYCTAIIQDNGWRIPSDYPQKIFY